MKRPQLSLPIADEKGEKEEEKEFWMGLGLEGKVIGDALSFAGDL
jgi:hypothetical protein